MTGKFRTAEEAFFWFMRDDVPFMQGQGLVIARVIHELRLKNVLDRDAMHVLGWYAKKKKPPNPQHEKEFRSAAIWHDAMEAIEPELINRGIVESRVLA